MIKFIFMQPGQFLVNKDGEKRKILGVIGEVVITSQNNRFDFAMCPVTKKELENLEFSLLEEPWVLALSEPYWYVSSEGTIILTNWGYYGMNKHKFRYVIGNVHRTSRDAELYKQKLIETMGRKEK